MNATTITNAIGGFCFTGLPPGTYTVCEVMQPGWVCTSPGGGCIAVVLSAGQNANVSFGNHACPDAPIACAVPPRCTVDWWPFDACSGVLGRDVAGGNHVTLTGTAAWNAGHPTCALLCAPGDPTSFAEDASTNNLLFFGKGSFGVDAWILSYGPDPSRRAVVDQRAGVVGTLDRQGFMLFLENGSLGLEIADNGLPPTYDDYVSGPVTLHDGQWHHVAGIVCRDSTDTLNVLTNRVQLFVDGAPVAQWAGAQVRHGSVTNPAPLRFGQQEAAFFPQAPFAGLIDEVEIYDCCVDGGTIASIYAADFRGKCREACYVPSVTAVSPFTATVTVNLTIRNFSAAAQNYVWAIAGLPVGGNCAVAGPSAFAPPGGGVTAPAFGFVTIPVTITVPSGLSGSDVACYQFTALNVASGHCLTCTGALRRASLNVLNSGGIHPVVSGSTTTVGFSLSNTTPAIASMRLRVSEPGDPIDPTTQVVRLNGLPAGTPFEQDVTLGPGESMTLAVDAEPERFEPMVTHRLLLTGSPSEGGQVLAADEPLGEVAVISVPDDAPIVEVGDTAEPAMDIGPKLVLGPNPFRGSLALRVVLARSGETVVDVLDMSGRLVRRMHAGTLGPGATELEWDGRAAWGSPAPSGLYLVRVRQGDSETSSKALRLR